MAALRSTDASSFAAKRKSIRVFPVTVKLTAEEQRAVTSSARSKGMARGQWIRDVLLAELKRDPESHDPALAEILGVRLLLVNVLRPLAAGQKLSPEFFDKLLDDISTAKHELAEKIGVGQKR